MAKDEAPGISEETKTIIEDQVKKGKARKFFMIYKGANIRTVVVFKKGQYGPKITQAKKDGFRGDVAYGVVTGSGKNLFFQLPGNLTVAEAMKVDSFEEKPPTKVAKLRQFLADFGLEFKPSYHILTDIAHAPDPDAETDVPVGPPPPDSEVFDEEDAASPDVAPASDGTDTELKARLASLLPRIKAAVGTPAGDEAKLRASEAGVFARKGDFQQANALLDRVEELLDGGSSTTGPAPSATEDRAAATTESQPASRWDQVRTDVVTHLKSLAKQIAEAKHPQSASAIIELKAVISQIAGTPSDLQQVAEMQRYLVDDDVVSDVSELADDIRTPLMDALEDLKAQLA